MRKSAAALALVAALALAACEKTGENEFEVNTPDVDVGTNVDTVRTPDVDVNTGEDTVTVPTVDVDVNDGNTNNPD